MSFQGLRLDTIGIADERLEASKEGLGQVRPCPWGAARAVLWVLARGPRRGEFPSICMPLG